MLDLAAAPAPAGALMTRQRQPSDDLASACAQHTCAQQSAPEAFLYRFTHDPVAVATLLLAAVTAALWVATYRLWRTTLGMADDARESSSHQLRAYIGISDVWIPEVGDEGRFSLTNYGQTPAFDVTATCTINGGKDDVHRVGILDPGQAGVSRFGLAGNKITLPFTIARTIKLQMKLVYRDINEDRWERSQSFILEAGNAIKLREGSHIADFSREHGKSSEKKIGTLEP
jgi:hypothetical protein